VGSPAQYGYRNKIELSAISGPRGLSLGFARIGTADLLPVDACLLLPEGAQSIPKALTGALRFLSSRGATGILRASVRVSGTGEVAVDLWTLAGSFPRSAAARVVTESTSARTVTRVIVRGAAERRDISQVEVLAGPPVWHEKLNGDQYAVSAPSFFQVNTAAAARLRALAVGMIAADGSTRVADLFAGVGTFTLPLARVAGAVVAVETSRWALADLRRNLDRAGLSVEIVPGDAAHALPSLGHLDAVIVDPPRSGLSDATVQALIEIRASRLIYVSCDPATLARDVARLQAHGYGPARFVPVDLFPQTYHLETVALLERD
jgi:23S rRNA (uracil1939-C5)-methyltransferase